MTTESLKLDKNLFSAKYLVIILLFVNAYEFGLQPNFPKPRLL